MTNEMTRLVFLRFQKSSLFLSVAFIFLYIFLLSLSLSLSLSECWQLLLFCVFVLTVRLVCFRGFQGMTLSLVIVILPLVLPRPNPGLGEILCVQGWRIFCFVSVMTFDSWCLHEQTSKCSLSLCLAVSVLSLDPVLHLFKPPPPRPPPPPPPRPQYFLKISVPFY